MMQLPVFRKHSPVVKCVGVGSYELGESQLLTIRGFCKPIVKELAALNQPW